MAWYGFGRMWKCLVGICGFLVGNTTCRTVVVSLVNIANSALAGFLVFEMTKTEIRSSPAGELVAVLALDWGSYKEADTFWMLLASVAMTGLYILASDRHERNIMRYGDPKYLEALATKLHLNSLSEKTEDDIRQGNIKTLPQVLERYRR